MPSFSITLTVDQKCPNLSAKWTMPGKYLIYEVFQVISIFHFKEQGSNAHCEKIIYYSRYPIQYVFGN